RGDNDNASGWAWRRPMRRFPPVLRWRSARYGRAQVLDEFVQRSGPRDMETLRHVAAVAPQPFQLLGLLHALGDHAQPQAMRQGDRRQADRRVTRIAMHVLHETAV